MRFLTKLAEFMESQKTSPVKGMEIECDLQCQLCHEYVDGGEYFHIEKLLKWKCSQGHISFIEDFRL